MSRIILSTVSHKTTHMAAQRLYGKTADGEKLYKHLLGMWTTTKASSRKELIRKDRDRAKLIAQGIEGPSISHIELFVEKLLSINTELDGTDMLEMKPPTLAMHVLEAAHEHHPSFIDGLEGRHAGEKPEAWMTNFDTFWAELHTCLLNHKSTRDDSDCARDADVLATSTSTPCLAGLEAQIGALAEQLRTLQETTPTSAAPPSRVLFTSRPRKGGAPPLCTSCACGYAHFPHPNHGCVGKSVAEGTITRTAAMRAFSRATDPAAAVDKAVERYNSHNNRSEVLPMQPQRSVQLMLMARSDDCLADGLATLRVDTQAEDIILCDPAFFTELDTSTNIGITTIAAGGAPARIAGIGTARLTLADGTILSIQRAHLLPGGKANVLSTEKIKDKALIDFRADGLRRAPTLRCGVLRVPCATGGYSLGHGCAQTPPRGILCHPLNRCEMFFRARGFRGGHQRAARSLLPA